MFNVELVLCGISTGLHRDLDNMIQIEYVNALLEVGQAPSVNVQLTDDIPQDMIDKLAEMGVK